jgi:hypothetical protein
LPTASSIQCIAKPGTGRAIARLTENTQAISIAATERDRHDVVDLQLRGHVRDTVEPRTNHPIRPDPRLEESIASAPA